MLQLLRIYQMESQWKCKNEKKRELMREKKKSKKEKKKIRMISWKNGTEWGGLSSRLKSFIGVN